jgi:hypothetical protein
MRELDGRGGFPKAWDRTRKTASSACEYVRVMSHDYAGIPEGCVSVKRDLFIWQKRPIHIGIRDQQTRLAALAKGEMRKANARHTVRGRLQNRARDLGGREGEEEGGGGGGEERRGNEEEERER